MGQEFERLPDLQNKSFKNIKALDNIEEISLNPQYRKTFDSMLKEGIEDKRKYCAPLEALLWIVYDRGLTSCEVLERYELRNLLQTAWRNTSVSETLPPSDGKILMK